MVYKTRLFSLLWFRTRACIRCTNRSHLTPPVRSVFLLLATVSTPCPYCTLLLYVDYCTLRGYDATYWMQRGVQVWVWRPGYYATVEPRFCRPRSRLSTKRSLGPVLPRLDGDGKNRFAWCLLGRSDINSVFKKWHNDGVAMECNLCFILKHVLKWLKYIWLSKKYIIGILFQNMY